MEEREHSVLVTIHYQMPTVPASACTVRYEVFGDGTVEVKLDYKAVKGLPEMPEFGMLFKLDADFDRVTAAGPLVRLLVTAAAARNQGCRYSHSQHCRNKFFHMNTPPYTLQCL